MVAGDGEGLVADEGPVLVGASPVELEAAERGGVGCRAEAGAEEGVEARFAGVAVRDGGDGEGSWDVSEFGVRAVVGEDDERFGI